MPFAAALSQATSSSRAVEEVVAAIRATMPGPVDLVVAFGSPHHGDHLATLASELQGRLEGRCLLGCRGEAIVGMGKEVEGSPALSVWAAKWTQPVEQTAFHLTLEQTSEGYSILGWPDELQHADPAESVILMVGDPFSFPADGFLQQVNEDFGGLRVIGGMSSGAEEPGNGGLLLGSSLLQAGAVGVLLQGGPRVRSVVSQGCRPIGKAMVITKSRENIILELGGKPALAQLQSLWSELPANEQELVRQGLHIGRVLSEFKDEFQRGDFLVRNVIGLDRASGAIAITDRVRVGQTVQFHVRDAATADEDLHEMLQIDRAAQERPPAAALLFTCNGRGKRLFDGPDHDAKVLESELGPIPTAGFFAQGELGPVSGQNFIHGFTASVALFED